MQDTEMAALRAAVRAQNNLVEKLRRIIHDLMDVSGDKCTDEECPICHPQPRFQVIEGGRDDD